MRQLNCSYVTQRAIPGYIWNAVIFSSYITLENATQKFYFYSLLKVKISEVNYITRKRSQIRGLVEYGSSWDQSVLLWTLLFNSKPFLSWFCFKVKIQTRIEFKVKLKLFMPHSGCISSGLKYWMEAKRLKREYLVKNERITFRLQYSNRWGVYK